ncbi:hypothetical protein IAU60_005207 [Kwoniella sp. DSM 27419]
MANQGLSGFDLSDILESLDGSESLVSEIESLFSSSGVAKRQIVCDAFLELLNEDVVGSSAQEQRRTAILRDTALAYTPVFLPVVATIPAAVSIMELTAHYAKPKEMVLALTEGIQSVLERAEGFVVSDDESDFEEEEDAIDWPALITEYDLSVKLLIACTPRLTTSKSTPTLLSLQEVISSTLPIVSHHTTPESARRLLERLCDLIQAISAWVETTADKGGEQRSILTDLLFSSIALLGHRVNAGLTEKWFLRTYPKFARLQPSGNSQTDQVDGRDDGMLVLEKASTTARSLLLTPGNLLQRVIDPSHLAVHASLASLTLLSAQIASASDKQSSPLPSPLPTDILEDSMPILSAALSGSSVDAALTWIWTVMDTDSTAEVTTHGGITLNFDAASMLVELMVPLTAQSPSPMIRLACFKLIGAILGNLKDADDRVQLLRQLLEPANPFDNVRVQVLSLVREQLSAAQHHKVDFHPSLFKSLTDLLFTMSEDDSDLTPAEILASPHPAWWTEVLTLVWFAFELGEQTIDDLKHTPHLQDWLERVERSLLRVQRYLESFEARDDQDFEGERFVALRWEDALHRAKSAIV